MSEMRYPIGIQDFKSLREGGYVYVDKTRHVYRLTHEGKYYFLSRPRRFGKSLLTSTFEAYFLGQRELFRGLAIEGLEKDWVKYPMLHLDLSTSEYKKPESLWEVLDSALTDWERTYGRPEKVMSNGLRFKELVRRAYETTGRPVVILVDEYDKPMVETITNEELQAGYRAQLKAFYSVLKTQDRYIRFAFLTGVSRFSRVSIFSDLNNLEDISLQTDYADLCGITEQELHSYFRQSIEKLARMHNMIYDEAARELGRRYDGYHFGLDVPGVYNPFSLLSALKRGQFDDYWFATGTPTFLVELLKTNDYDLEQLKCQNVSADSLINIESYLDDPVPILYQSGYLTIKGGNPEFNEYTLGFPNGEVERSFLNFLLPYYTPVTRSKTSLVLKNFVTDVRRGQPEQFMQRLTSFYANTNYKLVGDMEKYFHNSLFLIFTLMGQYTEAEQNTSRGCIDIVVKTADYIYIIECKLDCSAREALQQIEDKQYAAPFAADPRRLYKIGINFSSETRGISEYEIA